MPAPDNLYLAWVTPAVLLLLGAIAVGLWYLYYKHTYLLWLSASQGLSALATGWQSMLPVEAASIAALGLALLYMTAAIYTFQSMGGRLGQRLHLALPVCLAACGVAGVGYSIFIEAHVTGVCLLDSSDSTTAPLAAHRPAPWAGPYQPDAGTSCALCY